MPTAKQRYNMTVDAAVRYFATHGYVSNEVVDEWAERLEVAARDAMVSPATMSHLLAGHLQAVYNRVTTKYQKRPPTFGRIVKAGGFTPNHFLAMARTVPLLRRDLDQRVAASADLIKLNRDEAIAQTLRRFKGWASSVPPGGSASKYGKAQDDVRKPLQRLPYIERRVLVDQGHKLNSSLNGTLAENTGALAGRWHSHWKQLHYKYRPDHKERDGLVYAIRGNWALEKGLMKPGPAGYTDQITAPAEEINCRCYFEYIYNLDALPDDMISEKGWKALEDADDVLRGAA